MLVSVQTTKGLERRMEVQVPAARVEEAVNARLRELGRTVRIQGFRPGKVPPAVVRQRYGQQVQQEVIEELVRRSFAEAVIEQKLQPAGGPRIEAIPTIQTGQDLKYTATFEVYPEIDLQGLDALEIEQPVVEITTEDVDRMIDYLRKQRPNWTDVARPAQAGDRVIIDFTGTIDAVPFPGGQGEDVPVILGAGRMLPDLEQGLEGVEAGSEKTIPVKFPEDYPTREGGPNLAGQTTEFKVAVKQVQAPELPPVDEEFCKAYGIEGGVEELRRQVEANMLREVEQTTRSRLQNEVLTKLLAANPSVELPAALVDQAVSDMQVDWARRTGVYEVEKIPPRENFEPAAKRRVALGLLLGEIIQREKMQADPGQVEERLRAMVRAAHDAHPHRHDSSEELQQHLQDMLRKYQRDPQAVRQAESIVLEDQAIEWLLARARKVERRQSFQEFTRFGEES